MSEVITAQEAWENPETIRRTVVWPFELEQAVAEYAERIDSTPIEVITQWVRAALEANGYHLSGNGDGGNGGGLDQVADASASEPPESA